MTYHQVPHSSWPRPILSPTESRELFPIGIREHSGIKIDVARLVVWLKSHIRVNRDVCFQTITQLPSLTRFRPTILYQTI